MPITAELSKEFYDKFGNAVVDELVNWLNQVDATYRNELRASLARLEGGLIARIGLAESRQTRLTLLVSVATLGTLAALLKL